MTNIKIDTFIFNSIDNQPKNNVIKKNISWFQCFLCNENHFYFQEETSLYILPDVYV